MLVLTTATRRNMTEDGIVYLTECKLKANAQVLVPDVEPRMGQTFLQVFRRI
jgi:hypothetical protein